MPLIAGAATLVPDSYRYWSPNSSFCFSSASASACALVEVIVFSQSAERVEMMNVPGATRSGLKRPNGPSMPMPTLPRLENAATWLSESLMPANGVLVVVVTTSFSTSLPSSSVSVTVLVTLVYDSAAISRSVSIAPTVITFLAVPGAVMVFGLALRPLSVPEPELPAGNT